jgi:N6-adenosine-specific RNA methylase IME4
VKYRTIVADPPWHMEATGARNEHDGAGWKPGFRSYLPYETMGLEEICDLPVPDLAERDSHLYLWTFNRYLREAFYVVDAWGFTFSTILTWCKAPRGIGLGGAHTLTTEHVLFCRRGTLRAKQRVDSTWWQWPRGAHSQKPEAFLDLVESVSPPPYLELFARRQRLGWDTWGNEALEHVSLEAS